MKNLTGKKYGRLTVIRKSETYKKGRVKWYCICECGNHCDVQGRFLISGGTKSCGCLAREMAKVFATEMVEKRLQMGETENKDMKQRALKTIRHRHYVDGIDTTALTQKIRTDNKSGVKGIHYDKSRSKWKVEIGVNGKNRYVGRFDSLEEAKEARKIAESIYHEPLINKLNEEKREENNETKKLSSLEN